MTQGEPPFSPQRSSAAGGVRYRFQDCEVDPASYRLLVHGNAVSIEPRVFELVVYLIEHRERVVSKDELLERLWAGKYVTESTLTRAIYEARRALGDDSRQQRIIKTLHSRGYQFVATLESEAIEPADADIAPPPPIEASAAPAPVSRSKPRWQVMTLGVALAIVIGAITWLWLRQTPDAQRERIAIAPFSIDANVSDLSWAELGLPGLVADTLGTRANLTVFSANRVRQALLQRGVGSDAPHEEQLRALRDVFGVDYVLFAQVGRENTQLTVDYDLLGASGARLAGATRGGGAGSVAVALASSLADAMNVAYKAGIPLRTIGPDEFINEAFARGLQAQLGGQLEDSVRYFQVCLSNDPANGWVQYELGNSLRLLSRWPEAAQSYEAARLRGIDAGDANLEASAAAGLGLLAWRQGRLADAERLFETARGKFAAIDRRANLAAAYGNLGILADNRRDFPRARNYYEQALNLYRSEGERAGESAVYSNLAVIERKLGRMDAAAQLQQRAVDLQRRVGLNQMLVFSLAHLGEIERERGRWDDARQAIEESLRFARLSRDRLGEADALAARAGLAKDFERHDAALEDLQSALLIYEELDNPAGRARTALRLIEMKSLAPAEALELANTALAQAKKLDDEALALEAELARASFGRSDLAPLLPRLQVLGDHRLLALSWALRARRDHSDSHLRTALEHAHRSGDNRLQAELAIELARMLMSQDASPAEVEPLLAQAEAWQPDFPPTLIARTCHFARTQRMEQAEAFWTRVKALLGKTPDITWCPAGESLQAA